MQPQNAVDTTGGHPTQSAATSSSPSTFAGRKRTREPDNPAPTEYYKIPGMSDLSEQELKQNELLSKRYHKKE